MYFHAPNRNPRKLSRMEITPSFYSKRLFYPFPIPVSSCFGKCILKSQILVHKYWTILDHFCILVLFASRCHQHILKNMNITFSAISGNTGTPEMFQYSPILGHSSIWDMKYTFSLVSCIDVFCGCLKLKPCALVSCTAMPWANNYVYISLLVSEEPIITILSIFSPSYLDYQ